ncbi:hypothetical protein [Pseudonocardia sp. HH130629-09]|uniref:hypothetical protein n=1 Tax=Pseudonocardia sp. HH130629-09 TaxID=1641402 RepID=UPI0006CB1C24|nr:hypothetical protein [Pseudonocardia sp. HH130629-09]ALE82505.1 hypothetical protein XF36_04565 [Pseudonocardia sp. HH130629-09]
MDDTAAARVADLDLADVQSSFASGLAPDAPYHHREATALEYRRFLLLALTHPELEVHPGGPVERFRRLHADRPRFTEDCAALVAGTGVDPGRLAPPPCSDGHLPDERVHHLYRHTFPGGDTDLWGWPVPRSYPRVSAPGLGIVHTRLDGAVDDGTRDELRREALALRPGALDGHSGASTIERGCVTGGYGGFCYADAGPALLEWHWSDSLARRIREETGVVVAPTGVFYNVHRDGDGSPLHTDPVATELVVLTLLDGPVEPLYLHPELASTRLEDIGELSRRTNGHPDGGVPFDIGPTPFLMSGQMVPHHRRPAVRSAEVVVAAQFFGVVAPAA